MTDRAGTSSSLLGKSPKPGRLSSLFPTKDLTLGTSQPKRQFTPNLALAGKRANLPCETKNNNRRDGESKKPYDRPNNRGGRGGTRGRGAGKNAEMVQAKGIFSEGVTIETFAKNKSDTDYLGVGGFGSRLGSSGGKKNKSEGLGSSISIKTEGSFESDEQALIQLKADSFIDDNQEPEIPFVRLPLSLNRDASKQSDLSSSVKQTISLMSKVKLEQLVKSEAAVETFETAAEQYRSDSPELMLIQLPSVLGDLLDAANQEIKKPIEHLSQPVSETPSAEKPHCLSQFPDGIIGKLQLLESGKVRMLIGNQKFYIDVGATTHFLQEVVSVDLREGEGDFNVLGRIKHRVKVFSDVETLLLGISQPSSTPDDSNVRR